MRRLLSLVVGLLCVAGVSAAGCNSDGNNDNSGTDAGGGTTDSGTTDNGIDGGTKDSGFDGGTADSGFDGGTTDRGDGGTATDGGACAKNADCASQGPYSVCRKAQCVSLVTSQCTTVYATKTPASTAYLDDTAIIFGSILPTVGPDAPIGHLLEDSIKLALDDFAKADGIPGLNGGANRPLVLVGCNDGVNEDQTDVVAKHLVNDLGVPAIIGHAFSGNTIKVAQEVTIPNNVLLVSPSATSAQITALGSADNDLVWRTAPSDTLQAPALASYYCSARAAAVAKYPAIGALPTKVAIVNHNDAYGSGIGDALEASLKFNGTSALSQAGTNYLRVNYGSSSAPDLTKVPTIVSFAPHIIYLLGFDEGPDQIFTAVENGWKAAVPSDGHYPFWVFSDGSEVASLWASTTNPARAADITTDDQRTRVTGSVPGVSATSWPPYGAFLNAFSSSSYAADGSADTLGPASAYDILYLLAYSTVMVGTNPLTGPNLVKYGLGQMQKTAGLPTVQIGRNNILSTFPMLGTSAINVTGASGPLPFNGKGDISSADMQIWCIPPATAPDTDVGGAAITSGFYFSGATGSMAGSVTATCAGSISVPTTCP